MTTFVVIDDKYDTMAQYSEPIGSMETDYAEDTTEIAVKLEPEEKQESSESEDEIMLSRLQDMGEELCAKLRQPQPSLEAAAPEADLSWSSYQPTLQENTTNEDQFSATTWLRERKDRYVTLNDTPISSIEGSHSAPLEEKSAEIKETAEARDEAETTPEESIVEERDQVAEERFSDAQSEEPVEDEADDTQVVDDAMDDIDIDKIVIAAAESILKPEPPSLDMNETGDKFMDARLTVSFREDSMTSDEEQDSEKKTNGTLDKYSMRKDVTAFDSLLNKLGMTQQDAKAESNHTRTTASSTLGNSMSIGNLSAIMTETSHTRASAATNSVSLDAVYTLNSAAVSASVHSKSTTWAAEQAPTPFCQLNMNAINNAMEGYDNDDEDESTWFGFRENMHPSVALLLNPLSSSFTEGSTVFGTEFDDENESLLDSDDDEQTDALTEALRSVDDSEVDAFLRNDSDPSELIASSASLTVTDEEVDETDAEENQLFVDVDFSLQDLFWSALTPQCGLLPAPSDDEIAFQTSNDNTDGENEDDDTFVTADNDSTVMGEMDDDDNLVTQFEQNQLVSNLWQLVSPRFSTPREEDEVQFCCSCSTSRADVSLHSSTVEEDEPPAITEEKATKQKVPKVLDGCNERKGNKSDEEGEGGIAIMVDYDSDTTTKEPQAEDQDVEILLQEHMEIVSKIDSVLEEIREIDGGSEHERRPRKFSFDLTVIDCDDNEYSERTTRTEEREFVSGDSFSIDGVPSNESMCIPAPPKQEDSDAFVSPLDSVSYDSSVLTYSSDDMQVVVLRDLTLSKNDNSSHRRRHSLDHIPNYNNLFDFQKPVILPFLQEKGNVKEDSFHTANTTAPVTPKKVLHLHNDTINFESETTSQSDALANNASHSRNEATFLSIWTDTENIDESGQSSRLSTRARFSPKPPLSSKANSKSDSKAFSAMATTPSPRMSKKAPVTPTSMKLPKGILKKDGASGSGRSIRWNEEQLKAKEEKGVLFSSFRNARSVCPLDKLVLEITEVKDEVGEQ